MREASLPFHPSVVQQGQETFHLDAHPMQVHIASMRTSLPKSAAADKGNALTPHTDAVRPAAHVQRMAGNQAMQRAMSGAPLPRELRSSLETYFRTPLDRVRIHSDDESQLAADDLGARAFTVGQHIHLGTEGAATTGTARNELLAHEVVHTLQQGQVGPRAKLKVGAADDSYERQADRLSEGFARGGLRAPDAISNAGPVIQRSMLQGHFGKFEDAKYGFVTDSAGANIGGEMYLKFHPEDNARADVIALTQVTRGIQKGVPYTEGVTGMHQATSGPGRGAFVDAREGDPNPLYAASRVLKTGGDPSKPQDFETEPVTATTAAQQKSGTVRGKHFEGGGQHGYRKVVNGKFVTKPAEMYDVPNYGQALPNSLQFFETAALAVEGVQKDTYYGSVQWGWYTDSKGKMTQLPFRLLSQGVPTVTFLTAASIWNSSKAEFAYEVTSKTDMLSSATFATIRTFNGQEHVKPTGGAATSGATSFLEVTFGSYKGLIDTTKLRPVAIGAETMDLPVPMVHTVTNAQGTNMAIDRAASGTKLLPQGTRITITSCLAPTRALPNHYAGRIVDGPHLGTQGFFFAPDLTLERLGKR